tara:strand:+ start:1589 stop:1960 length:372 start_codon:yes stop_codon:yes gene_type:complete
MSIDKITPEDYNKSPEEDYWVTEKLSDYEKEDKSTFGENLGEDISDKEWDKQIDAKASKRQVGGDHYKKLAIQPAEYCFRNNLNNLESEAISYITRSRFKNGSEDIKKAIHTLEMLLEYTVIK